MFTHRVHIQIAPNRLLEDPPVATYNVGKVHTSQFSGRKKCPLCLVAVTNCLDNLDWQAMISREVETWSDIPFAQSLTRAVPNYF